MYVFEEMIGDKKLTEIINETHENVKYLPGHKLPANVVSVENTFSVKPVTVPFIVLLSLSQVQCVLKWFIQVFFRPT